MVDGDRRGEEGVAGDGAGKEEIALGNKVAQAEQRGVAKLAIMLELLRERFPILRCGVIHDDEIGMKPARDLKSEGSVVFLMNRIAVRVFQSAPDGAGETRLVIDEKNLPALFRSHAFWLSIACASTLEQTGDDVDGEREDDGVEGKREDAVQEDEPAHLA